jgi:hypothetical protein
MPVLRRSLHAEDVFGAFTPVSLSTTACGLLRAFLRLWCLPVSDRSEDGAAVRLAGGGVFKIATAGKPCCYRRCVAGDDSVTVPRMAL